MGGVTVTVVHVVDVVAVLHHRVAAIRPVLVFVTFMDDVHHVVALVVMPVMRPVDVAVVKVVRVVLVGKRDVTALGAVLMRMIGVSPMRLHVFDLSWAASYCKPPPAEFSGACERSKPLRQPAGSGRLPSRHPGAEQGRP